jgi:hypothetical protein
MEKCQAQNTDSFIERGTEDKKTVQEMLLKN